MRVEFDLSFQRKIAYRPVLLLHDAIEIDKITRPRLLIDREKLVYGDIEQTVYSERTLFLRRVDTLKRIVRELRLDSLISNLEKEKVAVERLLGARARDTCAF